MAVSIADKVRAAGVVGAGGAGFPTHVKLDAKVELVLCNGASCEPLLDSDPWLMTHRAAEVIQGLSLAMEAVGAAKGLVCIKKKHPEAIDALNEALAAFGAGEAMGVFELDDYYPAGDEQVLVHQVTGRVVPEGGIPLMVGVVVSNTESLVNIAAAQKGQPVVDRYLTVCGEVARPLVAKVPLGISLAEVIDLAGGAKISDFEVVDGGPMMGKVARDINQPVTKTTSGVIVLPRGHFVTEKKTVDPERIKKLARIACCQCNRCTDLCPRYLLGHGLQPHRIMRAISGSGGLAIAGQEEAVKAALICSECGVCEKFACPMMISPREVNARLKQELMAAGIRRESGEKTYRPSEFIAWRRIPTKRLIERLQVGAYAGHPDFFEGPVEPERVVLPLKQHLGAPAKAVVKAGDRVQRGDLIGEIPEKALGARVHASISGRVVRVDEAIEIEKV